MLPQRKHPRLRQYDYSAPGAYFITVGTHNRRQTLGSIRFGAMQCSRLGELLQQQWRRLPAHYGPRLRLDELAVMPNHFHGLFTILPERLFPGAPEVPAAGVIVGGLKSGVSREWNAPRGEEKVKVWHDRFHDHVVRHQEAFNRIREYIMNNPRMWSTDRENPRQTGENEFYRWFEAYCRKTRPPA